MFKINIGKGVLILTFKPSWKLRDFKIGLTYKFER